MKKLTYLNKLPLVLFILFFKCASSQDISFDWVKAFKSAGYKRGASLLIVENKSIIIVGEFSTTTDFDPGPNIYDLTFPSNSLYSGDQCMFITKLDSVGNFLWAKNIGAGTRVNSITSDLNGNLIIYGLSLSYYLTDLDPGPGVYYIDSANYTYQFVLKLDRNGNFIWAKPVPRTNSSTTAPYGITTDALNNIIIVGKFDIKKDFDPGPDTFFLYSAPFTSIQYGTVFTKDIFVLKLDNDGNFIWVKQIKTSESGVGNDAFTVKTDPFQNIYVSGGFENKVDFDTGPGVNNLISSGYQDIFISKFDKDGNFIWAKQMGGENIDVAESMELDKFGNIYTTGLFHGTVDFDPGPDIYNLSAPRNLANTFISKLDNNGNFVFTKQFVNTTNTVVGRALTLDRNNNIYITGPFSSSVDFDPGPGQYNINSGGNQKAYITKLSENGSFIWAAAFLHDPNCCSVITNSIKLDESDNIYTTGSFSGKIDFDPNPPVFNETSVDNSGDAFVHKLKQCKLSYNSLTINSCSNYTINGITYDSSGLYYQSVPNTAGCDSIITLNITITNKPIQASAMACGSYFWNGNLLNNSGVYKDTLTTISGCDSIVVLNLTINKPAIKIINEKICQGTSYAGYTTTGSFTDTLFTITGCDSVRVLNLEVLENPKPNLGNDTNTCVGKTILLTPGRFQKYAWNTNEISEKIIISDPGLYWVQVTDKNNCIASDSITIKESDNCTLFAIPNAFTPNGDGINDEFKPTINMHIAKYVFTIYNRWGKKVFETNDHTKGWNGNINGITQSTGNYIYIISFLGNANKPFLEKGNFILLK